MRNFLIELGIELRIEMLKNSVLKKKSIPFVYLSTYAGQALIEEAYNLTVQGFFKKSGKC